MRSYLEICIFPILIPLSMACLGGFGGGGSQCCPPRAGPICPTSQCGQPQPFAAPQPIPQYLAPQQAPLPYYPQAAPPAYAQPPAPVQPPSPFQPVPQPYSPPLNSGNTYLQAPAPQQQFIEKYASIPSSPQKPQAPASNPHSTTSSSYGRKSQNSKTSTTPSALKPEDGYNFTLQDEDDITDHRQQQVESADKKLESAETNDQRDNNN